MRVTVVVNRHGGTVAKGGDTIVARIAEAFRVHGIDADVQPVAPQDLAAAFARAADGAPDGIVAAGGDGTISCAANAAVAADIPLGIVPLGTLNHFARDAGLPLDIEGAVAAIADRSERRVDVGELNGRIFVNNSSIGLYPMIVRERDLQRRWHSAGRSLAMLLASLRALRDFPRKCLRVRIANRQAAIGTPLLMIGNNRYEPSLTTLGRRSRLDGGTLSVYAVLASSRWRFLQLGLLALVGRLDQQRAFVALEGFSAAEIDSLGPRLQVATDGETMLLETPLRYRIRPGALRLLGRPSAPGP